MRDYDEDPRHKFDFDDSPMICANCHERVLPITERINHYGTGNEMPGPWTEYIERCPACGAEWEEEEEEDEMD